MNPSSQHITNTMQTKLFVILILGLIFLIPIIATAQEATDEPQVDTTVTEEPVEQPTQVEEPPPATDEPLTSTPEPVVTTEVEADATEPPDISVEVTEEVVSESTEEPAADTEDSTDTENPDESDEEVEEPVVDITSINEDFEEWTGDDWSITDWSVAQVDDSLALTTLVANASTQVISLDWTDYAIDVDVKVEAGNTLTLGFQDYQLVMASDGRNRLSLDDTIVATSPATDTIEDATVTWHHIHIIKDNSLLNVTVDNVPQYSVETTDSPLGILAFVAGTDTGVAIDNLSMAELTGDDIETVEVISTPAPPTELPDPLAETTEEPDLLAEATEDPLAETTEEPDLLAEATEDPLAETTEEPDLLAETTDEPSVLAEVVEEPTYVVTNIITDDFEGDLSAWSTTASIVEVADGNHVLLLAAGGQLSPATPTESGNIVFAGQANILNDVETPGNFTITFSDTYAVQISTTGVTISDNDVIVLAVESPLTVNTWFTFVVESTSTGIKVSINDVVVAEYDAELILNGNFVVTSNTSTMFEDVTVDSLTLNEPLATPTPEALIEDSLSKLGGVAEEFINAYLTGGDEAVAAYLTETSAPQDEAGRILVDILVAKDYDGETIAQLITDQGGDVQRVFEHTVEAYVDVPLLIAITGNEGIRFIRNINRAVSTGPTGPVGTKGSDPTWTEGFNLLSIEEWNLAGVAGQDVKIGVIDTGFQHADGTWGDNLPCVANPIPLYTPDGSGNLFDSSFPNIVRDHGTRIIEVICDIAPASDVYMFRADDASSLQEALSATRNPANRMDIVLITLDLGVNTSAGGGLSGSIDTNIYGEIEAAKNNGMVVIAAAGNNNLRSLVLEVPSGETSTTTIDLALTDGDQIKFGWNDFDDDGSSLARFNVSLAGAGNDSANSNDPLVNPLSLTATSDDDTVTLSITPSQNNSGTTYLQVQIVPITVNGETPFSTDENDVKFTSVPTLGGSTLDITADDDVGNLGRPADSDHVISVGAICTRILENPSRWEFSSNGPRFDEDGSPNSGIGGVVTQELAKPTIMSYSFVSTRDYFSAPEGDPPDAEGLLSCTDGFGGTSAAAAHVAGMTALLMSNDANASFSDMNESNANDSDTFEAIRDYLQARSVDLPLGANADGFDTDFGAGLSILGAPTYDLNDTENPTADADQLPGNCNGSNTYYVGQANMGNHTLNGTIANPFTSIAHALNATTPECVIVMPGEYVTPLFVEQDYSSNPLLVTGYNDVSRITTGDVIFWLRGLYFHPDKEYEYTSSTTPGSEVPYRRRAGLFFGDGSNSVEFSGFTFVAARFYTGSNGSNTSSPQAVVMDHSTDTIVSNSQFGAINLNGIEYPGWDFNDATPVLILNQTVGGRVENSIFNDNSAETLGAYPTVAIIHSGSTANPISIIGNEMYGNTMTSDALLAEWGAILYAEGSHIDIINNAIHDNTGETIVKIATTNPSQDLSLTSITPTSDRQARIVGNVFLNNTTDSDDNTGTEGALINARYAPFMYIINNTIVGNNIPSLNPFGQLISRGNANSITADGSATAGREFWEIHNNLIYNNTFYELVGDTNTTKQCSRVPNDFSDGLLYAFGYAFNETFIPTNDGAPGDTTDDVFFQRGAQNNWIVDNTVIAPSAFGDCQTAIASSKSTPGSAAFRNLNIIDADQQPVHIRNAFGGDDSPLAQDGDFQGINPDSPFTVTDWQYYALTNTYTDPLDNSNNEYSDGIDAAPNRWLSDDSGSGDTNDPYMDNADIADDIIGTRRELDVNNWQIDYSLIPPRGISASDDATYTIDFGAFEYSPLQFETNDTDGGTGDDFYNTDLVINVQGDDIDPVTAGLQEDNGIVTFDISTVVTGGFGDLSFTILEHPANYGTQCGPEFENTKGLVNQGAGFNEFFDYCPPPNFFTSSSNSTIPSFVGFKVIVMDEAGANATGELRFTIDPDADDGSPNDDADYGDQNVQIGDETPITDIFEVVTTLGADVSVRLRPYTRFDNFFFSEGGNPEFVDGTGKKLIDYPFTYQITSIVENDGGNPVIAVSPGVDGGFTDSPIRSFSMSEANKGFATVTYSVQDGRGNVSAGNILIIRSVSIIPTEGLFDDTSFIWNYSDSVNAEFYTERNGNDTADVPDSGDWVALREAGAINDTIHITTALNDTATFRYIGTGFTVFMRGGNEDGSHFTLNMYDDDTTIYSPVTNTEEWAPISVGSVVNELDVAPNLNCTTRAGIFVDGNDPLNPLNGKALVHNLDAYTITCNGLTVRKHTVQIVNTGGGELSVDAFVIINDDTLVFTDANPIPPGFHDIDNGVLRNAFGAEWVEAFDTEFSNGVALNAIIAPSDVSFTITGASGFAIGSTYLDNDSSFNICVDDDDVFNNEGICTTVNDNTGETANGIHHPFFGLEPTVDYTITLTNLDASFVFDDLVVFDESMLPSGNLPLGRTDYVSTDLVLGEPFGDDWEESDNKQIIADNRSPIGPFVSFQMGDDVDTMAIKIDNPVPPPVCTSKQIKNGTCPPPPPSGLTGLAICVNRANTADNGGNNFANCIVAETENNTFDFMDTNGVLQNGVETLAVTEGLLSIPETLFRGDNWGDEGNNTVEIFSLTNDDDLEFEYVLLLSSVSGLGAGTYEEYSPGIDFVEYDVSDNSYTKVEIDDASDAFITSELTRCIKFKKGNCTETEVIGTTLGTTGVGNAIIFKVAGTGMAPLFTESPGSFARICWQADSTIADGNPNTIEPPEAIVAEMQAEALTNGGCQIVDNDGSSAIQKQERVVFGLNNATYHVMIELLPSPTTNPVSMFFDGVTVFGDDWTTLTALTPGQRYETSFVNRVADNMFHYIGTWETKADTEGTHSGTSYDETDSDVGANILFRTSGGNMINIIRDLQSPQVICDGKDIDKGKCDAPNGDLSNVIECSNKDQKKGNCPTPNDGFSDVTICVAPLANPEMRNCAVYSSDGNSTQAILPIALNDDFTIADYIVSISSFTDAGFVIDAVEVFDTTAGTMTVGIYEETSNLILYDAAKTELLKNTSFENSQLLLNTGLGDDWDWNISAGVSGSITTERAFIGSSSGNVAATVAGQGITSETFDIVNGNSYSVVARVYVDSASVGNVEMQMPSVGDFVTQTSKFTDVWQLMRFDFVATGNVADAQVEFVAAIGATSFFVDDVHVYQGGSWNFGSGGLTDGFIATSSGHGSKASFTFNGTGFALKLASNTTSGETRVCYDNDLDLSSPNCFTYDDEQPIPPEVECSKSQKKNNECPEPLPDSSKNGHGVTGLTSDDYIVTVQQLDNGLQTYSDPANSERTSASTVKVDYVEIFDNTAPPVLSSGLYNEDALISNDPGAHYLPSDDWVQITGAQASSYTGSSFYQVVDGNTVGSMFALTFDNSQQTSIVVDIFQANPDANQILACITDVDGEIEFDGTQHNLIDGDATDECVLTTQAVNQNVLVFNEANLPLMDGSGGNRIFTLRSLTKASFVVDGYQVLYGTTLTDGYYEEIIGFGDTVDSILQLNSLADWALITDETYSGGNALQTSVDTATMDFTFTGTGVSFVMQNSNRNGDVSIELNNAGICGGSCDEEIGDMSNLSFNGGAITIAGLPFDTYDVTLTANINVGNNEAIIVDAIEIFGQLQELGSLYDDAQVDTNGTPLLTFGPRRSVWIPVDGSTGSFLNNTYHTTDTVGGSVSFVVNAPAPTEGIIIYDGNPNNISRNVEVCWSFLNGGTLQRDCNPIINLDDNQSTQRVDPPNGAGTYNVSITNLDNGNPLVIDAIQVIEQGMMTEGIYQDDYTGFAFSDVYTQVNNSNASDGSVMQLDNNETVTFTFTGIAFSAQIIESSTNFHVCAFASGGSCASDVVNDNVTNSNSIVSAVSYGGFHNADGSDNDEWTVVITNNDVANALFIDRVDILGNNNDLEIVDLNVHEAGEPDIRYLPFGSWTETTTFKDETPLNGARFDTGIPGSIAYFEFNDNFGSGDVGFEYVRQIQDFDQVCVKEKKGNCTAFEDVTAFADATVCYGEVGEPDSRVCEPVENDGAGVFQFPTSIDPPACTDGCWAFIQYQRAGASDTITPLDYIRLYDPNATLIAGTYQENHPNIDDSGTGVIPAVADDNANVGFFDLISGTDVESYFNFTFQGTGLSVSSFAGPNAEDISLCVIDYTGGAVPDPTDPSNCLRTYNNQQDDNGFLTRSLIGLHHGADYMAIVKADLGSTTALGFDQVTIYDDQWFTETDLDDNTFLNELLGGESYEVDFKTRNTDKIVKFFGDWQSVTEQVLVGYENEKKKKGPIFVTEEGDRGMGSGASALFRTDNANAVSVEIELGEEGSVQLCAIPMTSSANFEVDLTENATCQTFTQSGRSFASLVFGNDTDPHVVTVELLSDTWMSLYNVDIFDFTGGLTEGHYDHSVPGLIYDISFNSLINEPMETANVDWDTIGGSAQSVQSISSAACDLDANCSEPEPKFEGDTSRKVTANIGQGIKYVGPGGTGVDLANDTYYTAIAHVYIDPTTVGSITMKLVDGINNITEVDGLELTTTTTGAWQTIRADFLTQSSYTDILLQLVVQGGQTIFYVDNVTLTTGGQWTTESPPIITPECGKKDKNCQDPFPLFDAFGGNYFQSTTPGASFMFDFVGTGFELGLVGGNLTGEVQVCYDNDADFSDANCFTYIQDDGLPAIDVVCTKFKKGNCSKSETAVNDTTNIVGRSVVGLANDTWTVKVYERDDGYSLSNTLEARTEAAEQCVKFKKGNCSQTDFVPIFANAIFGLDYIRIFEDTDIISVPAGVFNEDATDVSDDNYLSLYPEENWQSFAGSSAFSKKTYTAPTNGSEVSTMPGPAALVQLDVDALDDTWTVVFQFGSETTNVANTVLICVDNANGEMIWDGNQFGLANSTNCKLINDVDAIGQASVNSEEIPVLATTGTHNVWATALTSGFFRIDGFQIFEGGVLTVGLHNVILPDPLVDFSPAMLSVSSTCDPESDWCFNKTKDVLQDVCIKFKKGKCSKTQLQLVSTNAYLGGAAVTSDSEASMSFVAEGTGFSIISDVHENGLDFRVCYKLASSETSFPSIGSGDETFALQGFDGAGLPILVGEGGVLCENLTTDTDNWSNVMDREQSEGPQYGFSFYGLPFAAYEAQVMVTTSQNQISEDETFTIDAINVFSNGLLLNSMSDGLFDDTDDSFSYEPDPFWDFNATSDTYLNTDSTSDHAGAIAQFTVEGNALVLYHMIGNMSSDIQVCLLISNENIHCTVEAERQTRLARQVTSFTQEGEQVLVEICTKFKKGKCSKTSTTLQTAVVPFTPVVFFGLGENETHQIIMENRVNGETFNIDAIQVID